MHHHYIGKRVKSCSSFLCSMTELSPRFIDELLKRVYAAADSLGDKADQTLVWLLYVGSVKPHHLAPLIDHTNLMPTATKADIEKLSREAGEYNFASVCVLPPAVPYAVPVLSGSSVAVCTVVGFPLGATYASVKAYEARAAIEAGAQEVDMVINHALLKQHEISALRDDIATVADAVSSSGGKVLKVILDAAYHTPEQVAVATQQVLDVSLAYPAVRFFTKTSTGMELDKILVSKYSGPQKGAREEDLRTIVGVHSHFANEHHDDEGHVSQGLYSLEFAGIKASGGIRTYEDALFMLYAMGARLDPCLQSKDYRLGTSAGVSIVKK